MSSKYIYKTNQALVGNIVTSKYYSTSLYILCPYRIDSISLLDLPISYKTYYLLISLAALIVLLSINYTLLALSYRLISIRLFIYLYNYTSI